MLITATTSNKVFRIPLILDDKFKAKNN
jgi:hypothetical protein